MTARLLPIFPLQQVVLFPKVRCPLHIFEPRYRQMTEQALAGDARIGMVTVRPGHAGGMAGDPPIFSVGCEGRIVESARLPDGRYDILLLGERRFRIADEPARPAGRLYRCARVDPLEDAFDPTDRSRVAALRARTLELVGQLVARASRGESRFEPGRFGGADDATLVNTLCSVLDLEPAEKQALLEEGEVAGRFARLAGCLEFRLAELAGGLPPAPRPVH